MTNFEKLKNMTPEQIAAKFMIFRPSDACFDDENRNYYALDGSWHQYSQDCFQANVKWLNEEIPKDPQDYIKELEAENKQLRRERDQAVENLKAYEDIGLDPEEIKEILNAVNGGLAAKNGIWCPKCGDALDIDIVNGVLAIDCFGCGEYTPVSELMKLHLNDAVPVVRCKDCVYKASAEVIDGFLICPASGMEICDDDFCSYGERKESNE